MKSYRSAGIAAICAALSLALAATAPSADAQYRSPLSNANPKAGHHDGKAEIVWDAATHDFGTFNEDVGHVTHVFTGVNQGPDTATVSFLRASCGCTTPVTDIKVIPPGDTVRLKVTYDPYNRPGPFDKRISFNAIPGIRSTFHITGTVISSSKRLLAKYPHQVGSSFRLSDRNAAFGNLLEERNTTARILGMNNTTETLTPLVSGLPAWADAVVEPDRVEPGNAFAILLTAYGPKVGQYGLTVDTITVSSAEHPDMAIHMPASIIVLEALPELSEEQMMRAGYIEPAVKEIDFGNDIDPASKKQITRRVTLTNGGLEPVKIRRAYTVIPGFSIKAPEEIAPGKSAELEIKLRPCDLRKGTRSIDARIQIITNSPLNTFTDISARGTVAR